MVLDELRRRMVLDVEEGQSAVAPAGIGGVAVDKRVMKREAAPRAPTRLLAGGLVHARQPPAADNLGVVGSWRSMVTKI